MSLHAVLSHALVMALLALVVSSLAALSWWYLLLGCGLAGLLLWHRLRYVAPRELRVHTMTPADVQRWRETWDAANRGPGQDVIRASGVLIGADVDEPDIPDDTTLPPRLWHRRIDAMLREVTQRQGGPRG